MSKPNEKEQVITGTSHTGNLQEALDSAVSQVGHGQAWRLASIDGLVGGIVGNDVNVRIFAVTGRPAKDGGEGGEVEVPTTRTGLVRDIPEEVSICQDGATHELVSQTPRGEERLRLRATNPEAEQVLRDTAGTRQPVRVTGYIRHVECTRMDVYHAEPALAAEPARAE